MYGKLRIGLFDCLVDIGIVLNEVDKLITEVWQAASQCGHDGVVEMGTVLDEYFDPVAVENFSLNFGRVDQLVIFVQLR